MKKLKVLVNAYACSPNMGSEQGMAWNWCKHLAKYSELFIITESEYKDKIEKELNNLEYKDNLHFYYISVTPKVRKMCKNQGDWRFYYYYEKWQRKVLDTALQIISEYDIDIIHQLNMIGFREPGYLWEIQNIPLVWGPIGGLHQFPLKYLQDADTKFKAYFRLKTLINKLQIKYSRRVDKAIARADLLISATPDSYKAIKQHKGKESVHIPDQGTFIKSYGYEEDRFNNEDLQLIWVGKFDFGKQLHVAIRSIAATNNKNIILNIYGTGSEQQELGAKKLIKRLNISDQILFHGFCPYSEIQNKMRKADLMFFTSVSEGTPTVIMESISNHLPILCHDACGFGAVVNENIGIKVRLSNPSRSIAQFAESINDLYYNRNKLIEFSNNCLSHKQNISWDNNAIRVTEFYRKLTN